jgi:CelD/BcsL family acetyltransferase involved in cellulose biosynthesis
MYAWAAASLPDYLRLGPNNLLFWEAIREGARRGLQIYDFVSAKGSPGKFKSTFGADAVCVNTHWEHSRNAVIRLLRRLYEKRLRTRRRIRSEEPPSTAADAVAPGETSA